jgi:hypothetical protein
MRWARRLTDHLTYANVVATLALFVALGGASYAAVSLPANSVGSKQLRAGAVTPRAVGFPLGATSASDEQVVGHGRDECNGGAEGTGIVAPPCPAPTPQPVAGTSVQVSLIARGRLFISGLLAIANQGSTAATVEVAIEFDHYVPSVQRRYTVGAGQVLDASVQTVVPVPSGRHSAWLADDVEYSAAGTGEVLTGPASLVLTALPDQSG